MNPWLGILLVLLALGLLFLALRQLQKQRSTHPEVLRKLMHVSMGIVSISFPWLFDHAWPVVLLAASSIIGLLIVRSGALATGSFQGVLHGVKRTSWGELLFPVSVASVFVLADGDPLLYCVPILVLALADALAALIGLRYGLTQFKTLEGSKSIEGSLAFFIVTFLCVHVAVLLFGDTGRLEALMIGLLMGVIVTMFEAVAWRGLDNLFIPVGSYALLQHYIGMDAADIAIRLLIILLLGMLLLYWRKRSALDDSALIGAGLVAYGAWAIGDIYWLLVPLLVFLIANLMSQHMLHPEHKQTHNVYTIVGVAAPGFAWLFINSLHESIDLFFAYAVAFSSHLVMLGMCRSHFEKMRVLGASFVPAIVQGMFVLLLPFVLMWGLDKRLVYVSLIGGFILVLAALAFYQLQPELENCPETPSRWFRQAVIAGALSCLAWIAIILIVPGPTTP